MHKRLLPIILFFPLMGNADGIPDFETLFDFVIDHRSDVYFFHDAPYNPDDYRLTTTNMPVWTAIEAMSNRVEDAVAMIPSVATNNLRRDVLLLMAGHAGTNAFLRIWDGLLDIAETNSISVSPNLVDTFCLAGTTPLDCYVVFLYDNPSIRPLLERTRDLFPSNSPKRIWYDRTLSGAVEAEFRDYLIDSGEGLPWFAQ